MKAQQFEASGSPYINRDLSWLEFNRRVLEEAQDSTNPLLERLKFLSIVSTNLDEFMSVRVAGIKDQVKAGYTKRDFSGYTPSELFQLLMGKASEMVEDQYRTYRDVVRQLQAEQIKFVTYDELSSEERTRLERYYNEIVFPVLTPMAVDQSRPFPLVHSLGLYLSVVLKNGSEGEPLFAIVQVPSILDRFVEVNGSASVMRRFMRLEVLIKEHIHSMFPGYDPVSVHAFRLTRNADLTLNEEGAEDLLEEIEKELKKRRWGAPVRLEAEKGMSPFALSRLLEEFELDNSSVFAIDGPLDLGFLMKFTACCPWAEHLSHPPLEPVYPYEFAETDDLFSVLRRRDLMLYHPYESFEPVDEFVQQAASDPDVLAIKMTLYRVSGRSAIIRALSQAAEAGKQVTVVVEIKARFDEERNIAWARKLEKAGCHVVYGLVGLKTHAKIMLVVRREGRQLRRYVHVGTGNYNGNTARLYTDIGLFTTDPAIGEDASALFNDVTGYSAPHRWKRLAVAPDRMKGKLFELLDREADHARAGKSARVVAKMNSLSHQQMVDRLYEASQVGVQIDLIVRGVCCLRPGVPNLSENIRVFSIVDRFLEHARIFWFANGGDPDVWISSADWMTRNLTRRIEVMCPVLDRHLGQSMIAILESNLNDNIKVREMQADGRYERRLPAEAGERPYRSQFELMDVSTYKVRSGSV